MLVTSEGAADLPQDKRVVRRRLSYAGLGAVLLGASMYVASSDWRSGDELHTLVETAATVLAMVVGCLALVRYYSEKKAMFLFIGVGFVATAFLDGYQTFITSEYFAEVFSPAPARNGWSWFASATFLALLLWLSWLSWEREQRLGIAGKLSESMICAIVVGLALTSFAVVELAPLPRPFQEADVIGRPQELVPAALFLLALNGYLRKGQWKTEAFEHWLVLGLIMGLAGEAFFMALSHQVFDSMFVAAHVLKTGSYLCVMVGLLFNMSRLYSESLAQKELAFRNTILATQQESSQDAILVVDWQGKIVSHNHRFVQMSGVKQEVLDAGDDEPLLQAVVAQAADPQAFVARVRYLYAHRNEKSSEEVVFKDGRVFDRYSAPMVGLDGTDYGRVWFLRDITERKQAEREVLALQEQLRDQATRDPLTGLYNRRYLHDMLGRELLRASRAGHKVGLLMCDIDFFKKVNDTHGHLAGDEVLKVLAALLTSHARGSDIVCRFGGEEFVVVLADVRPEVARERAEQIRGELQATAIAFGQGVIHVAASFGIAMFPEDGKTQEELIRSADDAMYQAKTGGRNRVVMAHNGALHTAHA